MEAIPFPRYATRRSLFNQSTFSEWPLKVTQQTKSTVTARNFTPCLNTSMKDTAKKTLHRVAGWFAHLGLDMPVDCQRKGN